MIKIAFDATFRYKTSKIITVFNGFTEWSINLIKLYVYNSGSPKVLIVFYIWITVFLHPNNHFLLLCVSCFENFGFLWNTQVIHFTCRYNNGFQGFVSFSLIFVHGIPFLMWSNRKWERIFEVISSKNKKIKEKCEFQMKER